MPAVSIGMPVYNGAKCIRKALAFLCAAPSRVVVSGDFEALDEDGNFIIAAKTLERIRADIPWHIRACEFYRYPMSNAFLVI